MPFWRISQRDLAAHGVSGCYGPLFVAVALQRLDINRPNGEARDIEQGGDAVVKERVGFQMPHIYVILFVFTAIAAVLTHFIPAGLYDRVTLENGRVAINPESYRQVESTPVSLEQFMLAIPQGLVDASMVVFFTFIIGGLFMVIRTTGVIDIAVDKLTRRFANRSVLILPVLMLTFSVVATLIGTQELALVYVPVILPLMIALRFDSMTAVGVALLATTAGFSAGVLNPINTGLGQMIAEVPIYSGAGLRSLLFLLLVGSGVLYLTRYALKVRANPELSLMAGDSKEAEKRRHYQNEDIGEPMHFSPHLWSGAGRGGDAGAGAGDGYPGVWPG